MKRRLVDLSGTVPPGGLGWPFGCTLALAFFQGRLLLTPVIGHFTGTPQRTYCFSVAFLWISVDFCASLNYLGWGQKYIYIYSGLQRGNSRRVGGRYYPFPKLHLDRNWWPWWGPTVNPRMSSQRGRTSPGVSIIAARRVTLSRPDGGLPARIGGDAPLPPWPPRDLKRDEGRERRSGEGGGDTILMISAGRI